VGTLGRHLSRRCRTKARRLRSNVHPKPSHRLAKLIRSGDDARSHHSPHHRSTRRRAPGPLLRRANPTSAHILPLAGLSDAGHCGRLRACRRAGADLSRTDSSILLEGRRSSCLAPPTKNPARSTLRFPLPLPSRSKLPHAQKRHRPYYRARSIARVTPNSTATSR
jgi:hypothetical protein